MTYLELIEEVRKYLGREDITEMIPGFVRMAEAKMNRDLRLKLMERQAYTKTIPGQSAIALPDKRIPGDWDVFLSMRDLRLNGAILKNLDYLALDNIPERQTTGQPFSYAIRGRELVLVPAPDGEYELLLTYYAEIPPLSDSQPTNNISVRLPDLYLYGSLLASVPYARNSAPVEIWAASYNAVSQSAQTSDESGKFTRNVAFKPIRSI